MTINYPKIIFLNLIASVLIWILVFKIGIISGFENIIFLIACAGFAVSFFVKENLLVHYIKAMFLNSLFFGFLFVFIFDLFASSIDSQAKIDLIGSIIFMPFCGAVYFFGALAGIIPQGICERLRKQEKGNLSDRS